MVADLTDWRNYLKIMYSRRAFARAGSPWSVIREGDSDTARRRASAALSISIRAHAMSEPAGRSIVPRSL